MMIRRLLPLLLLVALPLPARAQLPMNIPDVCAGSSDNVAANTTVTISGTKGCVGVHGTAVVSGALSVNTILVYSDGFLDVQAGASITFRDTAVNTGVDPRQWSQGLIVIGRVRMLGTAKTPFRRVTADVLAGATTVTLASAPTNWVAGDEIFFPDTRQIPDDDRYNANYALRPEIRTITNVVGATVTFTPALTYDHRGARNANGTAASGFLPHVANLTRNIVIRSANPSGTRGHTAYTDRANVDIRNVVFRDMGRTTTDAVIDADASPNQIGRYPVHFHMLRGPVNPGNTGYQYTFTGNVVRDTRKWPVAIHSTHYGLVEDNVIIGGSQLSGAGIALEDGSETENMIRGNFVADIRGAIDPRNTGTGTESDGQHTGSGGECIWAAGFNNRFVNNVLNGCRNTAQNIVSGVGFKFFVNAAPSATVVLNPTIRGAAANEMVSVIGQNQPILEFDGNEVYGTTADAVTIWRLGTDGYGWNTSQATTTLKNLKAWHVHEGGIWFYPVNKITIENMSMRIDASVSRPPAIVAGDDYRVVNFTMTGGDIHAGAVLSCNARDPLETHRFENVTATTFGTAFCFETPATPGTGASRPSSGVTFQLVNNVITAWPGQPLRTIGMFHTLSRDNNDPNDPYIVQVTNHQGSVGDNFRTCFDVQATQNLYGGTCTVGTPRADISAIVTSTTPPTPPPPPSETCGNGIDDDGDGQIDEGCSTTPPDEICGDGIDNDRDGSIDEGCEVVPPPPPPVEDPPPGPFVLPAIQIVGADVTVSGAETTWNASSPTGYAFPWNSTQASYGVTPLFANTPSGTYALAFRVDSSRLAALGQDSSIGLLAFRPEPDINIHSAPVHALAVYRGDPGANPMVRAAEGRADGVVTYATSASLGTLTATTTAIVTWTPSNFALWVNGTLAEVVARTPHTSQQAKLMLAVWPGLTHSTDQQFLRGVTLAPVVYDRVLTSSEITDLHAALIAGVPDPDPPTPPPPPPVDPTITVSPTSVAWTFTPGQAAPASVAVTVTTSNGVPWSTSESSVFFDGTLFCATPGSCASGSTTTVTPASGFFSSLTAPGVYTGNLTITATGISTAKVVPVTLTVNQPPPIPPPTPNSLTAPTLTVTTCALSVTATPPDGGGWRVQYFDGTVSITGVSNRFTRPITLTRGLHSITARWTKTGSATQNSPPAVYTCD